MPRPLIAAALAAALCASVPCAQDAEPPADKTKFHLVLASGQSNMSGSGQPVLDAYKTPSDRVLFLDLDGRWKRMKTPMIPSRGMATSPAQVFARYYAEVYPDVTVGLVPGAMWGRSLKELSKGELDRDGKTRYYDEWMERVKKAREQGEAKAMLWHQGESDAGDADYNARFADYVKTLRADTGTAGLPVVAGELGRFATWTAGFNRRLADLPKTLEQAAVASSEGLADTGDRVHFSGYAVELLGARYLMAFLKMTDPAAAARFQPTLDRLEAETPALDQAAADRRARDKEEEIKRQTTPGANLLKNGDLSADTKDPEGWTSTWIDPAKSQGTLAVARDTFVFAGAPASLRIDTVGGAVAGSASQGVPGLAGAKIRFSGKLRRTEKAQAGAGLGCFDADWKMLKWISVDAGDVKTDAWTSFLAEGEVPAGTAQVNVGINLVGEGSVWADDLVLTRDGSAAAPAAAAPARAPRVNPPARPGGGRPPPPAAAAPTAAAGVNLLTNGDLSAAGDRPTGWTAVWVDAGKSVGQIAPARDAAVFAGAPASLRVETTGGQAIGAVSQRVNGIAGAKVRFAGKVRKGPGATAGAAFNCFDAHWKLVRYLGVDLGAMQDGEWKEFSAEAEIPAEAEIVNLGLNINGDGAVWFDDLVLTRVE